MSALTAAIPKDLVSKKVNDLTISEIKKVVKNSGLSKIQAFYPEKKKVELELGPFAPRLPGIPDWVNEKKKVELEVPTEFFNAKKNVTVEKLLDQIVNEWKKAAIEVDDLLSRIEIYEVDFFERLSKSISTKEFS